MEELGSDRKLYWDYAKYLSEQTDEGRTLTSVAEELSINLQLASKLRKAYKLYVLEYGIAKNRLERLSIYDLHDAHGRTLQLVKDKKSAENLISLLQSGRDFNDIRREAKAAPKTRAEHVIEKMGSRLEYWTVPKSKMAKYGDVFNIIEKYRQLISKSREHPLDAESLLVDCFVELSKLYVEG